MEAIVWSDYVCPWAYLRQDRTAILLGLGVAVTQLPYELHPETPLRGMAMSERAQTRFTQIYAAMDEAAMPFVAPARTPNSRLALEVSEVVRLRAPGTFRPLSASLFAAHFVTGDDIGDPAVIYRLVAAAGAAESEIAAAVDRGEGAAGVESARAAALDAGVTGTPAWLVGGRLLIPGLQPRETFTRLVRRMLTRDSFGQA